MKKIFKYLFLVIAIVFMSSNANAQEKNETTKVVDFYNKPVTIPDYIYAEELPQSYTDGMLESFKPFFENEEIPEDFREFISKTYPEKYNAVVKKINLIKSNNSDGLSAVEYKTILTELAKLNFETYEEYAHLYNKYFKNVEGFYSNFYLQMPTYVIYNYLGYNVQENLYNGNNNMSKIYDDIFNELIEDGVSETEAQKKTFEIMNQSINDWIKEQDIDYLNAYQGQVKQYIKTFNELGFKLENGYNLVLGDDASYEPITIKNIQDVGLISLNQNFHQVNLNQNKTDFLSPEEVYASAGFQEYVTQVTSPVNNLASYAKEDVLATLNEVIVGQYQALNMPGAHTQPISMVLPQVFSHYFNVIVETDQSMATSLTSWIDSATNETPHDTYRALNYIKVPKVEFEKAGSKEVTRTIKYEFSDGTKAAKTVVQKLQFNNITSLITNKTKWEVDEQTFASVENPKVVSPSKNYVVVNPTDKAQEQVVKYDSNNIEIKIIYKLEKKESSSKDKNKPEGSKKITKESKISKTGNNNNFLVVISIMLIILSGLRIKLSKKL